MSNETRYINRCLQLLMVALGCLLAGANGATADLNDGLVGYWSLDEGEGDTAYDYSGYGNDGTIYGAGWVPGVSGSALRFEWGDYLKSPSANGVGHQAISLSLWARFYSFSKENQFICVRAPGLGWERFFYFSTYRGSAPHNGLHMGVPTTGGAWSRGCSLNLGVFVPSRWYHVVGVVDTVEGRSRLYVDGSLVKSCGIATGDIPGSPYEMWIGMTHQGYQKTDGVFDEIRLYNRALSEDEVQQLYWFGQPDPPSDNTDGSQEAVSGTSNDPVNTATGSFFHQETDLSIPSRGVPLTFTRFYNSKAAAPGRKAAKSKQAPPERQTATSQPASTKDAERSSLRADKPDESTAGKAQEQAVASSKGQAKAKEESR